MKRILTFALAASVLASTTGCANMTPEERAALGGAIVGGLAVGLAAAASQPRHYRAPPPRMRTTDCYRYGNRTSCTTY